MNSNKKVANDPTAKLMYFIECLSSKFKLEIHKKYRDFMNYAKMSLADKKNLPEIAKSVIPEYLWVYLDDRRNIYERLKNEKFEIKEEFVKDFSYEWFVVYYFEPLDNLRKEIENNLSKEMKKNTIAINKKFVVYVTCPKLGTKNQIFDNLDKNDFVLKTSF